jgi:hypothetical protein
MHMNRTDAEVQSDRLSDALERIDSPLRATVTEHTMTSMDGDEWRTGTFLVVVDKTPVDDTEKAAKALSRLGHGADADRVQAALHGPHSRLARLRRRRP